MPAVGFVATRSAQHRRACQRDPTLPFAVRAYRLRHVMRRLVALLLALALLHLNVERVDAACATHHPAPAAGHEGMHHDGSAPTERTPCDTPVSSDCCQALASCASVLSLDAGSDTMASPAIVPLTIAAAVSERPLSRSTAPEPPPPKA